MQKTILEAYREAILHEMETDENVIVIGEDVGIGSTFGLYTKMLGRFGEDRIIDTPISEIALSGAAVGAAIAGKRPIVDFQFSDFIFCAMDQMVNQAAKMCYLTEGRFSIPITVCLPVGVNRRGAHHSQCIESIFMNVAGIKIVTPATPYDAKGLLASAIRENNPVLVCQHKLLYSVGKSGGQDWLCKDVPDEAYQIPLGKAAVVREGGDVTIVANMLMLHKAVEAAERLAEKNVQVEVIDPRTIKPLDVDTIYQSVKKTGRLVIVEECPVTGGWGNEAISAVAERMDSHFAVRRLGCAETPMPYAEVLENAVIPQVEKICETVLAIG